MHKDCKIASYLGWMTLIAFLFGTDQLSKWWILQNVAFGDMLQVLPSLQFTLALNKGIAFSLFSESKPLLKLGLLGLIFIICLILTYLFVQTPRADRWSRTALALMLGGALGNFMDRLLHGHVIDFIDFYIRDWHWYTFNLADVFITVGALMMAKTIFMPTISTHTGAK